MGAVSTQFFTGECTNASAVSLIFSMTAPQICSAPNTVFAPLKSTETPALPSLLAMAKRQRLASLATDGSSCFFPRRRFPSDTVLVWFLAACWCATSPTSRSASWNATTLGVL
jgi:hypothetical protein